MAREAKAGKKERRQREEIAADIARDCLGDLINRALYGSERFVLTRHGKPAAAIVSIDDLDALDAREVA